MREFLGMTSPLACNVALGCIGIPIMDVLKTLTLSTGVALVETA
jgi:hypothetical protein